MQCTLVWSNKYSGIIKVSRDYSEEVFEKLKSQPLAMISKDWKKRGIKFDS